LEVTLRSHQRAEQAVRVFLRVVTVIALMLFVPVLRANEQLGWLEAANRAKRALDRGDYETARLGAESSLATAGQQHGLESIQSATAMLLLGRIYGALAEHNKALQVERRSLAILEKLAGPEHSSTATALNSLALTYRALAQHEQALPLQLRSLAILEKSAGPEHQTTAAALNNIASTYRALAQHERALPIHAHAPR
jgi:hypothetical protein